MRCLPLQPGGPGLAATTATSYATATAAATATATAAATATATATAIATASGATLSGPATPATPGHRAPAGGVPLLQVAELSVSFVQRKGFPGGKPARFDAVKSVSFKVAAGQTLALIGASGCGKTMRSGLAG